MDSTKCKWHLHTTSYPHYCCTGGRHTPLEIKSEGFIGTPLSSWSVTRLENNGDECQIQFWNPMLFLSTVMPLRAIENK